MEELYVEIEVIENDDAREILVSVESFVVLFIFCYLDEPRDLKLKLVKGELNATKAKLKLQGTCWNWMHNRVINKNNNDRAIRDVRLPAYVKSDNTYISGMCAVCREIVSASKEDAHRTLLGFKQSCLLGPSEVSIWTRFCEVNIVEAVNYVLTADDFDSVPEEVALFEGHMNEPVRMHNIYKLARERAKDTSMKVTDGRKRRTIIDCSTPKEHLLIQHRFAEGVTFTIADLILYPCFRLIFYRCQNVMENFSTLHAWLNEIDSYHARCHEMLMKLCVFPAEQRRFDVFKMPTSKRSSLYKSDPKRYKPRSRIYTDQCEVDASLWKLQQLRVPFDSDCDIVYDERKIDWNAIEPEHEKSSALPEDRLERKRQQLENVANAVCSLATDGDRIVDFCCGTGHLGILLALQLPHCEVIFLENKAMSLERAKKRVRQLNLKNCSFYQCNIDYFDGIFDIGTSLHACGTATDIVLQQCMRHRAKFVCCPCCYGSLQPMPHIAYPRSKQFRSVVTERDLLYIAHTADQAHELGTPNCRPETSKQGQLCMDIIDTDRKLHAQEAGYEVILTRLKPENCTPKNRLLVGVLMAR